MRDNYVGDIGDYYKYILLRALAGQEPLLKLGVVWYLYPDKCHPGDGKHTAYLDPAKESRFRSCDPVLYDRLKQLIAEDARSVAEVQRRGILPASTAFFAEPLSFDGVMKEMRPAHRQAWLKQALLTTRGSDLVFVDPDNGLEVKSTPKHHDRGPKFCFYDELEAFWQHG